MCSYIINYSNAVRHILSYNCEKKSNSLQFFNTSLNPPRRRNHYLPADSFLASFFACATCLSRFANSLCLN